MRIIYEKKAMQGAGMSSKCPRNSFRRRGTEPAFRDSCVQNCLARFRRDSEKNSDNYSDFYAITLKASNLAQNLQNSLPGRDLTGISADFRRTSTFFAV